MCITERLIRDSYQAGMLFTNTICIPPYGRLHGTLDLLLEGRKQDKHVGVYGRLNKIKTTKNTHKFHLLDDETARAVGAADISVLLLLRPVWPPRVEAVVSSRVPARPCMRATPSHRIAMVVATPATDRSRWMRKRCRNWKAPTVLAKLRQKEVKKFLDELWFVNQ